MIHRWECAATCIILIQWDYNYPPFEKKEDIAKALYSSCLGNAQGQNQTITPLLSSAGHWCRRKSISVVPDHVLYSLIMLALSLLPLLVLVCLISSCHVSPLQCIINWVSRLCNTFSGTAVYSHKGERNTKESEVLSSVSPLRETPSL